MPDTIHPDRRLALTGSLLLTYGAIVGLLGHHVLGIDCSLAVVLAAAATGSATLTMLAHRAAQHGGEPAAITRTVAGICLVALFALVSLDLSFAAYRNHRTDATPPETARYGDAVTWIGEVYPPLYWHAATGIRLAKPGYAFSASHYGDGYTPALLAAPTLRDHVFSLKHVSMTIDQHGFRNQQAPQAARVFTLGDSFTFGWGVSDGAQWATRLAARLHEPVYNLGVHDSSPVEEVARLRYLLDSHPDTFRPTHVVWLLFEGNDLEDSRALVPAAVAQAQQATPLFMGTVVEWLTQLPWVVQHESVIDRFVRGELHLRTPAGTTDPYVVDGIRSPHPIVHSATHGHLLWLSEQLERARVSRPYVVEHPNYPRLAAAFTDMAGLARAHGFTVTVVLAPSAVRLYAPFVDQLDPPLAPAHLLNELARQARAADFPVVDLFAQLTPYAAQELLHFRDDDHWNARGHQRVAGLVATAMRHRRPA